MSGSSLLVCWFSYTWLFLSCVCVTLEVVCVEGRVGECCWSRCCTRLLYSGGQYIGGRCILEVAWVNSVGRVAVGRVAVGRVTVLWQLVRWRSVSWRLVCWWSVRWWSLYFVGRVVSVVVGGALVGRCSVVA